MKNKSEKNDDALKIPDRLPFVDKVSERLNSKIRKDNEKVLLAFYEKNWALNGIVATIEGKEERFLRILAKKHNSFLKNRL